MGDELIWAAEIQRAERTNKVVAVLSPFLALLRKVKNHLNSFQKHINTTFK